MNLLLFQHLLISWGHLVLFGSYKGKASPFRLKKRAHMQPIILSWVWEGDQEEDTKLACIKMSLHKSIRQRTTLNALIILVKSTILDPTTLQLPGIIQIQKCFAGLTIFYSIIQTGCEEYFAWYWLFRKTLFWLWIMLWGSGFNLWKYKSMLVWHHFPAIYRWSQVIKIESWKFSFQFGSNLEFES